MIPMTQTQKAWYFRALEARSAIMRAAVDEVHARHLGAFGEGCLSWEAVERAVMGHMHGDSKVIHDDTPLGTCVVDLLRLPGADREDLTLLVVALVRVHSLYVDLRDFATQEDTAMVSSGTLARRYVDHLASARARLDRLHHNRCHLPLLPEIDSDF